MNVLAWKRQNHPCHGANYTCRKPAVQRFYNPNITALTGVQLKFVASETWACDECWKVFQALRAKETANDRL